jgi:hypothetical protein
MIQFNSKDFNFKIGEHSLYKYDNVINYNFDWYQKQLLVNTEHNVSEILNDKSFYFIFDSAGNDALAHFIFESFIFIDIFFEVNKLYKNIKIVTKNKKQYFKNILKLFKITNNVVDYIDASNNYCFIHPIISISHEDIDLQLFEMYLTKYIEKIQKFQVPYEFQCNILFFPRNKKDNFSYNQVEILGLYEIECSLIECGATVIDTYQLNNLYFQIQLLYNHRIIILDYGSSLFFNCIYLTNKIIIVLNNRDWYDYQMNIPGYKFLFDIINKNNTIYIINNDSGKILFNNIKDLLLI